MLRGSNLRALGKEHQLLLALFLIDLAAGLVLFLPLVGRRNAGPKFYRLVIVIAIVLYAIAAASHVGAGRRDLALFEGAAILLGVAVLLLLRYPKRLTFQISALLFGIASLDAAVAAFDAAMRPAHLVWSIAGALSSVALLGSVTLAMTLGHWYLVVRGMPIDPLRRLTIATLVAVTIRLLIVIAAFAMGGSEITREIAVRQGIFFWMRAGWGLAGPILLFPMVWGTVKIRSTMAATGILYVDVVAVFIGEVLGGWLSAMARLPV